MDIHPTVVPKMHLNLKKGALHEALHVKQGRKLALAELEKAKKSSSPLMRKRAQFALNARKWHKGK